MGHLGFLSVAPTPNYGAPTCYLDSLLRIARKHSSTIRSNRSQKMSALVGKRGFPVQWTPISRIKEALYNKVPWVMVTWDPL